MTERPIEPGQQWGLRGRTDAAVRVTVTTWPCDGRLMVRFATGDEVPMEVSRLRQRYSLVSGAARKDEEASRDVDRVEA